MVTTFSLLLVNAGGNGFTEVVLQRPEIDHFQASNLFWINLGTGFVLTLAFASAGSLIAWFYGNPLVARIAIALSLTILVTSTSVLHLALLMRGMRIPAVYANQLFSRVLSLVLSISLAFAGWGYWALVAGLIAQPLSEGIGAWSLCRWIPALPRRVVGTESMVRFAIQVYGRFSFNYFSRNMDNLLVGWRFNAQALGFYKKAYDLFALSAILQSFTPIAVSALSRVAHDPQQYKRQLLRILSVWALLGMGVGGIVTLTGRDLVHVLLGPRWAPAGHIFTFFGPGFGLMFIYGCHGWIHLSIGRPGRWLKWGILEFLVTGGLFVLGLPWGPAGVAAAWTLSVLILLIPALCYAGSPIQLGILPVVSAIWKFAAASLLAGCITALAARTLQPFAAATDLIRVTARMLMISASFSVLYLGTVVILHRSCEPIIQGVALLREIAPKMPFPKSKLAGVAPCAAGTGTES